MEKLLLGVFYECGVDSKGFVIICLKGDKVLFCFDIVLLKCKFGVFDSCLLVDFLLIISIKVKDFVVEMVFINV